MEQITVMENEEPTLQPRGHFGPTQWTLVLSAAEQDSEKGRVALAELCRIYWYPLYCYVRRSGYDQHDAEDLTQGFFAQLLGKNYLGAVAREKGRFRSFLLTAIKHFLANERDRAQALKRGGGVKLISLDVAEAESRHPLEPRHGLTPEKMFERQWVLALLDRVLGQLKDECATGKKERHFERLKEFLTGDAPPQAAVALAGELGVSEGSLKVAIHRLRRRYRELLRAEIAQTVERPEEVDDEIHRLFSAFA